MKMNQKPVDLSIVVPCYNEEEALPIFYDTTLGIVKQMGITYEFVFVDDGSADGTLRILKEFYSKNPCSKFYSFSRNFGKEAAIYAGLKNATGRYVVLMDADLQDPPSYLPEMYKILQQGEYDNVATRRATRAGEPKLRSFFSRSFYKLINKITETEIVDGARDYRMMSRRMVDSIVNLGEYNRFSKGLFSWVGFKTYWLSYDNVERVAGKTKWSFWKLFKYAIDGIINFSSSPLHVATTTGIICTFASFVWMIYQVIKKLVLGDYNMSGWTSTICVIVFLGGLQLISIGIMGQYIARIFLETKNRPIYIIGDSCEDMPNYVPENQVPSGAETMNTQSSYTVPTGEAPSNSGETPSEGSGT